MVDILEFKRKEFTGGKDYTFESYSDFMKVYPYLLPKLEGEWDIAYIAENLTSVEELKANVAQSWIHIAVYLDKDLYAAYYTKYPSEKKEVLSNKDVCLKIIAESNLLIDPDATKELLYRVRNEPKTLRMMLVQLDDQCIDKHITIKDIRKYVPKNESVYAKSVVRYFINGERYRWEYLEKLISQLGDRYAFYAMRKAVSNLLKEKHKYLHNQDAQRGIEDLPATQIVRLYTLFTLAPNPQALVPIMSQFDAKGDF